MWLYEREVLSETLAMLLVATTIWLVYKFLAAPGTAIVIALGAVLGAMAMTASELVAVGVLLVLPLILLRRQVAVRTRICWLATAAAVCIAIMAPWSVFLSSRFDRPVVFAGAIGATMASGNCPQTYYGDRLGYDDQRCFFTAGTTSDPIASDSRGVSTRLFSSVRTKDAPSSSWPRCRPNIRPVPALPTNAPGDGAWDIGGSASGRVRHLLGVPTVRDRGGGHGATSDIAVYPLLVFPLLVVFTVVLTIGSVRYRAPAEIPLVLLVAVGLDAALSGLPRGRIGPAPPTRRSSNDGPRRPLTRGISPRVDFGPHQGQRGRGRVMTVRTFVREHRFGAWLSGVAVAGLAWRIVYDVITRHNTVGGDGFRYHYGALFLADGRGFATLTNLHLPDTGHPPGWTVVLRA